MKTATFQSLPKTPAANISNTDDEFLVPFDSNETTKYSPSFPPLDLVIRPTVPTDAAAYYLNRRPQTLRAWACLENGPIRPLRVNGRLAWPVEDIKSVMRGGAANCQEWQERFQELAVKYSHLGMCTDIEGMNIDEKYGVYLFLARMDSRSKP